MKTYGDPARVQVDVRGVSSDVVSYHTGRGKVHREPLPGNGSGIVEWRTSAEDSAFVRVEVPRAEKHMAALTARPS